MHWLTLGWWKYLFSKRVSSDVSWMMVLKCRIQNHPCGVVWYTSWPAIEPDMHCKNCGDDLG